MMFSRIFATCVRKQYHTHRLFDTNGGGGGGGKGPEIKAFIVLLLGIYFTIKRDK